MIRIYADFNSMDEQGRACLDVMGALRDIERHRASLKVGMKVILYTTDEFEVQATLIFDQIWLGVPDWDTIHYYKTKNNVTKEHLTELFHRALVAAADKAESKAKITLPRTFMINLQAFGNTADLLTCDQAIDQIYLGCDNFYKVIDVAIIAYRAAYSVAFVRVSGHPPGAFTETIAPEEFGPFNVLVSEKLDKLSQ